MENNILYQPSWNSLHQHPTPSWFRDAKFGIYTHWGVYAVPACGPNATWYPYNMYRPGTLQHDYHVRNYGGPEKFGYKDFIPMLTGEKFDPDDWSETFRNAGAQFAGPVGEHHDGFAMWNTRFSEWNATRMGPKRDVVGALEKAIRAQGMKFMVALHHAENWWFYPHWNPAYDTADPRYAGLYGEAHDTRGIPPGDDHNTLWWQQERPSKAFLDRWLGKIEELIDQYQPDMLWFDFALKFIQEDYKKSFLAYYYNKEREWGRDVVVTYKWHDLVPGSGVVDLELGRFDALTYQDWITDTTVDAGQGWGYLKETGYKTAKSLLHYLIDNVSKNGYLLLNVGPKADGSLPEEAKALLAEMGRWLVINGEAIYGTTPWMVYGEGPTQMRKAGAFMEDQEVQYTGQDIRFTCKDNALYAICLGWPGEEMIIRSLHRLYGSEIVSVRMLGSDQPLEWSQTPEGLKVFGLNRPTSSDAFTLKILRKPPFDPV